MHLRLGTALQRLLKLKTFKDHEGFIKRHLREEVLGKILQNDALLFDLISYELMARLFRLYIYESLAYEDIEPGTTGRFEIFALAQFALHEQDPRQGIDPNLWDLFKAAGRRNFSEAEVQRAVGMLRPAVQSLYPYIRDSIGVWHKRRQDALRSRSELIEERE